MSYMKGVNRMPMSKMIHSKANYVLCCYIGEGSGIVTWIKAKYWTWRILHMSDGEILKRYYELSDREVFESE